jgi:hypothetical protein
MTGRVQTNRNPATGVRPAAGTRKAGELHVNLADLQLSVIDAGQTPRDMLAVRFFSTTAGYASGVFVVNSGALYVSNTTVTPGPFNPAQWTRIGP